MPIMPINVKVDLGDRSHNDYSSMNNNGEVDDTHSIEGVKSLQ